MQQLYNISERFSKSLDEVRGPKRKKNYLKQAQAWIRPSAARRGAVRVIGFATLGLFVGTVFLTFYRRRNRRPGLGSFRLRAKKTILGLSEKAAQISQPKNLTQVSGKL